MSNESIIFVYNMKSDFMSKTTTLLKEALLDYYSCNLYRLTRSFFYHKKEWKHFLNDTPQDFQYYSKDEFIEKYPQCKFLRFPLVLLKPTEENFIEMIGHTAINDMTSLSDLTTQLSAVIRMYIIQGKRPEELEDIWDLEIESQ